MKAGILYAIGAYALWGVLPIYWKAVKIVPAPEILCHRILWSFVFLLALLGVKRHWRWLGGAIRNRTTRLTFLGTSFILSINWLTYIWAVNAGYIVDTSLGYFINPLINVFLGVLLLRERLRAFQWLAVGIAAGGILYLTIGYGSFPWIALVLAFSFASYGYLRKTASLGSLEGLSLEAGILSLPALGYLLFLEGACTGSFGHRGRGINLLLLFTGVATAVPLLGFASAARRITLTTLGLLQFIAPTLQFLVGVFVYEEPFIKTRLIGFCFIWAALLIYSVEGAIRGGKRIYGNRRQNP